MDITLNRILSLLDRKPNGDFVHGAKTRFAKSLGFKGGEVVAMWINGSSDSYKNYLYQISSLYDVSVEWLKGETDNPRFPGDKKERPAENGETLKESLPEDIRQLLSICQENPELASALLTVARQIEKGPAAQGRGGKE